MVKGNHDPMDHIGMVNKDSFRTSHFERLSSLVIFYGVCIHEYSVVSACPLFRGLLSFRLRVSFIRFHLTDMF